jgi:hypothetical protein
LSRGARPLLGEFGLDYEMDLRGVARELSR